MIRAFVINQLYNMANLLCVLAERLSPQDDSVWRDRMWKLYSDNVDNLVKRARADDDNERGYLNWEADK